MHPKAVTDIGRLISRVVDWKDKWARMAKEHRGELPVMWKMAAFMELCPAEVQNMVCRSIDEAMRTTRK